MGWFYRIAGRFPRLVIAKRNLSRAKARSALAAAAILIGVVAIGTIGAGGAAFKQSQLNLIQDQGANSVYIAPGPDHDAGHFDREDVRGIEETVGSSAIVATNQVGMDLATRAGGRQPISVTYTDDPRVVYDVARGEIPRTWRQQAIVSAGFARERQLDVGDRFTVIEETDGGETRRIYRVTAVLSETQAFGVSEVFLPMSELGERRYTQVEVRTRSVDRAEATAERLRAEYNDRKNRLFVFELTSLVRFFKSIVNGINIFLAGLAAISLLVAGVSIANTMLMAVIKRREEIGVRRAVGYSRMDVVRILLVEAGMLGAIGAVVGVTISLFATIVANSVFLGDPFAFTGESVQYLVGAVAFGVVTSLLAGAYPAWRAANERPVDALRD
jgi:putative ABC transport system permease protein